MKQIRIEDGSIEDALVFLKVIELSCEKAPSIDDAKYRLRLQKVIKTLNERVAQGKFYFSSEKNKGRQDRVINEGKGYVDDDLWRKTTDKVRKRRSRRTQKERGDKPYSIEVKKKMKEQLKEIRDTQECNSYNDVIVLLLKCYKKSSTHGWTEVKLS